MLHKTPWIHGEDRRDMAFFTLEDGAAHQLFGLPEHGIGMMWNIPRKPRTTLMAIEHLPDMIHCLRDAEIPAAPEGPVRLVFCEPLVKPCWIEITPEAAAINRAEICRALFAGYAEIYRRESEFRGEGEPPFGLGNADLEDLWLFGMDFAHHAGAVWILPQISAGSL
ncbi:hypothetical protein ACEUZ9_000752 [Paracoccus litorisediminis]|uniref:hypothetical protein n=1 Tax=Paracoccus litorisediminis TaxID=2006130 RepID=UPI003732655F